ncbi:hypothetical protein TH63_03925 [Rufibacter radiotolerans]|uniref:Uncharacterized protein n=1 Tax=Rufibacter radiotolerans TaxID=1379910 RepID=A0A0H4VMI5_9BACT|nr:hypothetical protein [Rufibacter radiotolerans]AKQ44969.1 hypothetical protein TH63_03925 [Rufibacter radiotolerans]
MNQHMTENEREVIKLINFFKKKGERLAEEGSLTQEHQDLNAACERLTEKIYNHADFRQQVLEKHETLKGIIEDSAQCPSCGKVDKLKKVGVATNELGWKSNRYKCRRCNIEFTWNRPNNPWDMIPFLEICLQELDTNLGSAEMEGDLRERAQGARDHMSVSLEQLRAAIASADEEKARMEEQDREMSRMLHEFKKYLLIEKIKLEPFSEN